MHLKKPLAALALGLALAAGLVAHPAARADNTVGPTNPIGLVTPTPPPNPVIAAEPLGHFFGHCDHGVCGGYEEDVIRVDGSRFTPDGPIEVQILDAQTYAIESAHTLTAGDHGGFGLDTLQPYCTRHGHMVLASDFFHHTSSNTVFIGPCLSF